MLPGAELKVSAGPIPFSGLQRGAAELRPLPASQRGPCPVPRGLPLHPQDQQSDVVLTLPLSVQPSRAVSAQILLPATRRGRHIGTVSLGSRGHAFAGSGGCDALVAGDHYAAGRRLGSSGSPGTSSLRIPRDDSTDVMFKPKVFKPHYFQAYP